MYREPKRQWKRKEKGNWRWTEKVQKKQEPDFSLVLPASELNFGAARNKSAEPPSPSSLSPLPLLGVVCELMMIGRRRSRWGGRVVGEGRRKSSSRGSTARRALKGGQAGAGTVRGAARRSELDSAGGTRVDRRATGNGYRVAIIHAQPPTCRHQIQPPSQRKRSTNSAPK